MPAVGQDATGADVILLLDSSLSMPLGDRYYKIDAAIGGVKTPKPYPEANPPDLEFHEWRKKNKPKELTAALRNEYETLLNERGFRTEDGGKLAFRDDLQELALLQKFRDERFAELVDQIVTFIDDGLPQQPPCSLTVVSFRNDVSDKDDPEPIKIVGSFDHGIGAGKAELKKKLAALKVKGGGSAIAAALEKGHQEASRLWNLQSDAAKRRRPYLLLITDGDDNPVDKDRKKIAAKLLKSRLADFKELLLQPSVAAAGKEFRVGEQYSLWYAHFGAANPELLESFTALRGEARPIQQFSLSGFVFNSSRLELPEALLHKSSPKEPSQRISVLGFNLPADAQLTIGKAEFPTVREWKRKDGTAIKAAFQSLESTKVTFADGTTESLDNLNESDKFRAQVFAYLQPLFAQTIALKKIEDQRLPIKLPDFTLPEGDFVVRLPITTNGLIITNRPYIEIAYRVKNPQVNLIATAPFEKGASKLTFTTDPVDYRAGNLQLKLKQPGPMKPALPAGITLKAANQEITAAGATVPLSALTEETATKALELTIQATIATETPAGEYPLVLEVSYNNVHFRDVPLNISVGSRPRISAAPALVVLNATDKTPGSASFDLVLEPQVVSVIGAKNRIGFELETLPENVILSISKQGEPKQQLHLVGQKKFCLFTLDKDALDKERITLHLEAEVKAGVTQPGTSVIKLLMLSNSPDLQLLPKSGLPKYGEIQVTTNVTIGKPTLELVANNDAKKILTQESAATYSLTLVPDGEAKQLESAPVQFALQDGVGDRTIQWFAGPSADNVQPLSFDPTSKEWRWLVSEIKSNLPLVFVAKFAPGPTPPPSLRNITVTATSTNPQLQFKQGQLKWQLQTASIIDVALTQDKLSWSPPVKEIPVAPQVVQFKLSPEAPPGPFEFRITNAASPISPLETATNVPKLQLFLNGQPVDEKTLLQIPGGAVRILELTWKFDLPEPEAKRWNYTFHLQPADPNVQLRTADLQLSITTTSLDWRGDKPPGLLTKNTRVWPFKLFVPFGDYPADSRLYKFEYQLGEGADALLVPGTIEAGEDNGQKGLWLHSADVLRQMPQSFNMDRTAQSKTIEVPFRLLLNDQNHRDTQIPLPSRQPYITYGGLYPVPLESSDTAQLTADFIPADKSQPIRLTPKRKPDGIDVYEVPANMGNVDLNFTSFVVLPTQGGPHFVKERRVFLLSSAAKPLDDVLLLLLKRAVNDGSSAPDIAIYPMPFTKSEPARDSTGGAVDNSAGQGPFRLSAQSVPSGANPEDLRFQLEVQRPHSLWRTQGNTRQLRIVEQLVLENGMEEWQETRLEFQIQPYTPPAFYGLMFLVALVCGAVVGLIVLAALARKSRSEYGLVMDRWLSADGGPLLLASGPLVKSKFKVEGPTKSRFAWLWEPFEFRHIRWSSFAEDWTQDSPVHYLGFALGSKGLELASTLPGTCTNLNDGSSQELTSGKWVLIDTYDSTVAQIRDLNIELKAPSQPGAAPALAPVDDEEAMLLSNLSGAAASQPTLRLSLRWWKPVRTTSAENPDQEQTFTSSGGPTRDPLDNYGEPEGI